jgi:hypothetical protein
VHNLRRPCGSDWSPHPRARRPRTHTCRAMARSKLPLGPKSPAGPRVHDQTDVDEWASLVDASVTCPPPLSRPFLPALPHPLRALCPAPQSAFRAALSPAPSLAHSTRQSPGATAPRRWKCADGTGLVPAFRKLRTQARALLASANRCSLYLVCVSDSPITFAESTERRARWKSTGRTAPRSTSGWSPRRTAQKCMAAKCPLPLRAPLPCPHRCQRRCALPALRRMPRIPPALSAEPASVRQRTRCRFRRC